MPSPHDLCVTLSPIFQSEAETCFLEDVVRLLNPRLGCLVEVLG